MLGLGPHAGFIVAAYAVTFVGIAALILATVADDRRQRRRLARLEHQDAQHQDAQHPDAQHQDAERHTHRRTRRGSAARPPRLKKTPA